MRYAMAYHSILKGHRTVFVTGMTDIGQRRVGDRPVCGKQFGDMEFGWVPKETLASPCSAGCNMVNSRHSVVD